MYYIQRVSKKLKIELINQHLFFIWIKFIAEVDFFLYVVVLIGELLDQLTQKMKQKLL